MQVQTRSTVSAARPVGASARRVSLAAVQQVKQASTTAAAGPQEEIYIGFVKEEGFGDRTGRKGRVIKDDPRKYPSRDWVGVGGWAGGEAGLWQLREQVTKEKESKKPAGPAPSSPLPVKIPKAPAGKAPVYIGFVKEEGFGSREGKRGRIVVDDPRKYAGKEDLGPLAGVTGGFAAGEVGLKQYVATGDVKLRAPGQPGPKQFSPLTLAGAVALAGAVGGVVLGLVNDAGEIEQTRELLQRAATDENTLKYVAVGAAAVGATAVLVAINNAVRALQRQLEENGGRVVVSAAFLAVVLLVAKGIIESQ
ncbi:hypothetical protein HYH02_000977 [Chlamydomonas schloesseri]|uniref:Uncharacterized protein n=1 Tax=Chlamydomonas schloesseri TaxID=2026947 RepID=A0A835WZP9_9CHLO|nr:hypothetical protein HYH02_000977 [Chlamydomonas schloesseri]|eukprot:KAG2455160.1 hypothetical protein HYH02_000977 [Chlamydomonas schloesseri]